MDLDSHRILNILHIPPEILISILEQATTERNDDRNSTLLALSLVCRSFRPIAQDLLSRYVYLPDESSWNTWSHIDIADSRKNTRSIWACAIAPTNETQRSLEIVLSETENLRSLSIYLRPHQLGVFGLSTLKNLTNLSLFIKAPRSIDPRLPCPTDIDVRFRLSALTLSGDFHASLPGPLLSSIVSTSLSTLTSLDLATWRDAHQPLLWTLISPLAPQLISFALPNDESSGSSLFLSSCTKLESLSCFAYNYRDPLPATLQCWRIRNDLSAYATAGLVTELQGKLKSLDLPYENEEHAVRIENGMRHLLLVCVKHHVRVRYAEGRREDGVVGEWERWI